MGVLTLFKKKQKENEKEEYKNLTVEQALALSGEENREQKEKKGRESRKKNRAEEEDLDREERNREEKEELDREKRNKIEEEELDREERNRAEEEILDREKRNKIKEEDLDKEERNRAEEEILDREKRNKIEEEDLDREEESRVEEAIEQESKKERKEKEKKEKRRKWKERKQKKEENIEKKEVTIFQNEGTGTTVLDTAKDNYSQIKELKRRLEDSKEEYAAITAYLTDIQRIDRLSLDKKAEIEDAARQIMNLNKERGKYRDKDQNDIQTRYLAQFEDIIPEELKKLYEEEKYQSLIKEDLRQLEGERGSINYERDMAVKKREFIRKFSIISCIVIFIIFCSLFILTQSVDADLNMAFFLSGVMALAVIGYIVVELRNTAYTIKYSALKMNKLITLTNKIKIKYVNATGVVEYAYEKYRVNSAAELSFLWEQYVKEKDETARYRHNTELLDFYHEELTENLRECGLTDPEIWIYQTDALLNEKEMVEVRHRLNIRRQKLRDRMDIDSKQLKQCKANLKEIKKKYPELEDDIAEMLYDINVEE